MGVPERRTHPKISPSSMKGLLRNNETLWDLLNKVLVGSRPVEALLTNPEYQKRVRVICHHLTRQQQTQSLYDFDDLYQEVCILVYLKIHMLRYIENEEGFFRWVAKVARNRFIDLKRKEIMQEERLDRRHDITSMITSAGGDNLPDLSVNLESEFLLKETMDSLSSEQRNIIQLRQEGFTMREIAEQMGCSHTKIARELQDSMGSLAWHYSSSRRKVKGGKSKRRLPIE